MKKILKSLFIVCSFFIMLPNAKALTSYTFKETCTAFKEPNEQGDWIVPEVYKNLDPGDVITLVDGTKVASTNSKCSTDYYYIDYMGYKGYACGDYINFNTEGKYYDELRTAGFPESYLLSLNALKEQHPNWIFTAFKTDLDFEQVITNQSNVEYDSYNQRYWSRSYIQTTNKLFLSKQNGSYNSSDDTYNQLETGGWYAANKQTVAYYVDPRNFLNIYDVFMFENLGYNSTYQTKDALTKIFSGTDLLQYVDYYMEAANYTDVEKKINNNVSPIFLGARSRQEVVKKDGTLSDSANGGSGVYNFYNLGANSTCDNPVACGLAYATGRSWTDPRTAIIGGASEIANGYINQKQNTLYFQKFNITGNIYGDFSHQYMTNISAPKSESRSTYNSYSKIENILDSNIEFVIPIYANMPEQASNLPITENDIVEVSDIKTLISELGYVVKNNYIIVDLDKNRNVFTNEMSNKGMNVTVTNENNLEILGTGDIITVTSGSTTETYTVVIKGDVSGDGKVKAYDYAKIKQYLMGSGSLDNAYKEAADYNNDNAVKAYDYKLIKDYIMAQ